MNRNHTQSYESSDSYRVVVEVSESASIKAMRVIFSNCSPLRLNKLPKISCVFTQDRLNNRNHAHSYESSESYRVVVGVSDSVSIKAMRVIFRNCSPLRFTKLPKILCVFTQDRLINRNLPKSYESSESYRVVVGVSEPVSIKAMRVIFRNCSPLRLTKLPKISCVFTQDRYIYRNHAQSYESSESYRVVVGVSESVSIKAMRVIFSNCSPLRLTILPKISCVFTQDR